LIFEPEVRQPPGSSLLRTRTPQGFGRLNSNRMGPRLELVTTAFRIVLTKSRREIRESRIRAPIVFQSRAGVRGLDVRAREVFPVST
jgi:hypothetical protein